MTINIRNRDKNKTINYFRTIAVSVLILIAIRILYSVCIWGINTSRLKLEECINNYDFVDFFNINNKRITKEETIYYRNKDICFNLIIDEKYHLSVFRVGRFSENFGLNNIQVLDTLENIRNNYDHVINVPTKIFPKDEYLGVYMSSFNSTILSEVNINEMSLYINGDVVHKKVVDKDLMIFQVNMGIAIFSLNKSKNKLDLSYIYYPNYASSSFIIFRKGKEGQLYIYITNYPIDMK